MTGRRARLLATGGAVVLAVVAAGTVQQAATARPGTTTARIPASAFAPVAIAPVKIDPTLLPVPAASPAPSPSPTTAPSPTVEPAPLPTRPPGPVHTVRAGDTLWDIARWHRVELAMVRRWNPDVPTDALVIGQRIDVPGGSSMPKANPRATPRATPRPATASAAAGVRVSGATHRWPLPVRGVVTTRFSGAHPGIDISAPAGTPVRAIAAGTVVFAGWKNNGGGYVVVLRHQGGMTSTYNHNQSVVVAMGMRVTAGQRIARVGSTGNSTGPHLDLRVQMGGRFVNPLRLF